MASPSINVPPSVLASAIAQFDQHPPPTLREILTAYKERGDGDKAMLMALLQAKTAEDERLASLASLHRSVLDLYYRYPSAAATSPASFSSRPPSPSNIHHSRKRPRYSHSRSPSPSHDDVPSRPSSIGNYSPRTHASMTIDSLLSSSSSSTVSTSRTDVEDERAQDRPSPPAKTQPPTISLSTTPTATVVM